MQTLVHEFRTARKPHHCELCGRQIESGERYLHQRNKEYGDIWTWRNCAHCDPLLGLLCNLGYADDYGVTMDVVSDWEPETIAQARLKVGWKRKWRRRDGSLYPVPDDSRAA